jgi:uncharacterized protein YjiS (DUF1127 family)
MHGGETMLCGAPPLALIERSRHSNPAAWSIPMSTTFGVTATFPRQPPLLPVAGLPQKNSWWPATAAWQLLQRWAERRAQRHALLELADQTRLLADIGLTRAQVVREAARPFWQA